MRCLSFFSYNGSINELIIRDIILDFRSIIKRHVSIIDKQKKCAYIMQEAVNNILNYYKKNSFIDDKKIKIDCSKEEDNNTAITLKFTSNMYRVDIPAFEKKIIKLNALQKTELKTELQSILDAPILKENSANLGLLSMILKSDEKLKYQFINIDDVFCTFTLVNHIK